MILFPFRLGVFALALTAMVSSVAAQQANDSTMQSQPAAAADATPAPDDKKLAADMVQANTAGGRHLAPRDTFYLLSYVSVKTGKGVEGFEPGQEVHLVEVNRPAHTLIVTDGHAQVEVPPSKLTNDLDIAAAVRQKDEANQAHVAAYIKAEQEAYNKFQRVAADATAKDLAQRREEQQKQAEEIERQEQTPVATTAEPVNPAGGGDGGYYGDGGYGYGNPYSYFGAPSTVVIGASRNNNTSAVPVAPTGSGASTGSKAVNPATVGTAGRPPR